MTNDQLDDETLAELIEFRRTMLNHHTEQGNKTKIALHQMVLVALIELQERRQASAKPIAYLYSASFERGHVEGQLTDAPGCDLPVYAAAPVVPEDVPDVLRDEIIDLCDGYEIGDAGAQEIWSACRATILEGNRA